MVINGVGDDKFFAQLLLDFETRSVSRKRDRRNTKTEATVGVDSDDEKIHIYIRIYIRKNISSYIYTHFKISEERDLEIRTVT